MLNVLAHELQRAARTVLDQDAIFTAVRGVHKRVRGPYAVVVMIAGYGLLAFRDPFGIRPLVLGKKYDARRQRMDAGLGVRASRYAGFERVDDVAPGEAVFVDLDRNMVRKQCAETHRCWRVLPWE